MCQPEKYIFSDRSLDVLNVLTKNIEINLEESVAREITEICPLQWGTLIDEDAKRFAIDILLGAGLLHLVSFFYT